ncbi:MAG: hypothetical protein A4E53_03404 [Pelotomaculum sp. PtaB.Bin104]|nr:MAG: hypothetical protein A4E53_03404 [Pelotomaculum sp. PtaB.Bin104]
MVFWAFFIIWVIFKDYWHILAEAILNGLAAGSLAQKAERWGVIADDIQEERQDRYVAKKGCR